MQIWTNAKVLQYIYIYIYILFIIELEQVTQKKFKKILKKNLSYLKKRYFKSKDNQVWFYN